MPAPIDTKIQLNLVTDYKTGEYNYSDLAKKYKIGEATVQRYCKNIDKRALKLEIEAEIDEINKKAIKEAYIKHGIDPDLIAEKTRKLLNSEVNTDVKAGIELYHKTMGTLAPEKTETDINTNIKGDMYRLKLPKRRLKAIQ